MSTAQVVVGVAVVVLLAVGTVLLVRRRRYVSALRGRGWVFDSRPPLESVLDHHAPPFGLGFERSTDELVSGRTRIGVPFRVFEYTAREDGPSFDERIASLQLPLALPELFLTGGAPRSGAALPAVEVAPGLTAAAADPAYARALLTSGMLAAVGSLASAGHAVDLSVDGPALVAIGAPKDPDQLDAYLELLAPVAAAVDPTALAAYAVTPPPAGFGFYGHPDWLLIGRDDTAIERHGLTTAGFGHTTEKLVRGFNDGLPIEAFVHRWKTTHTETSTDSEGQTQTRTVTDEHSEVVCAVELPFAFPRLSVNGGWGGKRVRFESEEFNDAFTVRSENAKLASDVLHPRTMEMLMAAPPPGFVIDQTSMRFDVSEHDTLLMGRCADFAHAFFGRVPSFVWHDLQIAPPHFRGSA